MTLSRLERWRRSRSREAKIWGASSATISVRELTPITLWTGEAITLRLPLKDLKTKGGDYLMVLLQVEGAGPILGAAEFDQL